MQLPNAEAQQRDGEFLHKEVADSSHLEIQTSVLEATTNAVLQLSEYAHLTSAARLVSLMSPEGCDASVFLSTFSPPFPRR